MAGRHHNIRQRPELYDSMQYLARDNLVRLVLSVLVLVAITLWSYWPVIADLVGAWQTNDDYSAGQLVPLVVAFLVWRERNRLKQCTLTPCWGAGIALLILAQTSRICGFLSFRSSPERYALLLSIAGLLLMVAGRQVFRRLLWVLLFLFLMVPLPGRVDNLISVPLRRMATTGAVFVLEAFGIRVSQQGNVVVLNGNMPLAVVEACSGLRMLTAFVIVAAFIAYMVKRAKWQKAVLLASSIPVAVIGNVIRIVATAILMLYVSSEVADKFFHDFAGYVMMPVAVMLLFAEIWLMDRIILPEPTTEKAKAVSRAKSAIKPYVEST